jgi:hypothetical protein
VGPRQTYFHDVTLASAPAGARHIGTSKPFLRAFSHSSRFYQFVSTDKTGVKHKEYSIMSVDLELMKSVIFHFIGITLTLNAPKE